VDFANYEIQDTSQSLHWDPSQATLHPFVFYFRLSDNSDLKNILYTVNSKVNIHDNANLCAFKQSTVQEIKKLPNISMIYFLLTQLHPTRKTKKLLLSLY
jgi:hypothetical protein